MIDGLSHALRQYEVKINSAATLEELKSFVYLRLEGSGNTERETMGAQAGTFSDCVMSLAIGVALLGATREAPATTRKRFREAMGLQPRGAQPTPRGQGYGGRRV